MRFPFPLGDGVFDAETRQEKAISFVDRLTGNGGFSEDPVSTFRRTLAVVCRGISSISLACDRLTEQIFPGDSHPDDLLADWEQHLKIIRRQPDTIEQRRAACAEVYADRNGDRKGLGEGSGRGMDTVRYLERVCGKGNVVYRFNTIADLLANGQDPLGIFSVAFEVPVSQIQTVGQIERLRQIVERHKPAHVGAAITRNVARGFLCNDALSRVDRDVVRV